MKSVKTFLKINTYSDTTDAKTNEVFFIKNDLFFKNSNNDVIKLSSNTLYHQYGLIYGLRIRYSAVVSNLTSDKFERVIIIRSITKDFEYKDFEIIGEDTGIFFNIEDPVNNTHSISENISNFYPFSEMKPVTLIQGGPSGYEYGCVKIPLFYKNKNLNFYPSKGTYIYYLISKFCYEDFEPCEGFFNQDGKLCNYISVTQFLGEDSPYIGDIWSEYGYYPHKTDGITLANPPRRLYPINERCYTFCLYYLNLIKTASFSPFKQFIDEYSPTFVSSDIPAFRNATQEANFDDDKLIITIRNINTNVFFANNEYVNTIIGIDSSENQSPRGFRDFITNTPSNLRYYNINGIVKIISDNECQISLNTDYRFIHECGENETYFIFFIKEIASSITNVTNVIRNEIIKNGKNYYITSDWITDIVQFPFSSQNSIFKIPDYTTNLATIDAITASNIEEFLTPMYHLCTPVFTYTSKNDLYKITNITQNIVKTKSFSSSSISNFSYYNDNLNLELLNITINHYQKLINTLITKKYYTSNPNDIVIYPYYSMRVSPITQIDRSYKIIGSLESYIDYSSRELTTPYLSFYFIGVCNITTEDEKLNYGWNNRSLYPLTNSMFNPKPESINSDYWYLDVDEDTNQLNAVYNNLIVTRYVLYYDEED